MWKKLAFAALGAIALAGMAMASVGITPPPGQGLIDGTWLLGLAGGQNFTYQSGVTALGTNQATATQLPTGIFLIEVDTAGSGGATGVALPTCAPGTVINLLNNTAYTFDIYPAVANNPSTAAQDTIITAGSAGTTSASQTEYTGKTYSCAKAGVWLGK